MAGSLRWLALAIITALAGCGGGEGGLSCSPAPTITSTPPTTATVGQLYQYVATGYYFCGLGTCFSIEGLELPPGATITNSLEKYIIWYPAEADAGKDIRFRIATGADSCGDRATQSWTVHVSAAPVIASFTASPAAVHAGASTQLTAVFSAGSGAITGIGPVTSGVAVSTPPINATTDFLLGVTGSGGYVLEQTLRVRVETAPVITRFVAVPGIVTAGDDVQFQWSLTGDADALRLDPGGIDLTGMGGQYQRALQASATYTLTASNLAGDTTTASVPVQVLPAPAIASLSATPASARLGESVRIVAQFQGGSGTLVPLDSTMPQQPVQSGVAVTTMPLFGSARFVLLVQNAAGAAVSQNLRVPLVGPGTFQPAPGQPLLAGRRGHSATLLADGRVLIAGGEYYENGWQATASAELFDPASGTFSSGPALRQARQGHTAALLGDGSVLLAGGSVAGTRVPDAERYDPATNTIGPAGTLPLFFAERARAVALADGRALLVAPGSGASGSTLFDPSSGQFAPAGAFQATHQCPIPERLADGRVLVVEGDRTQPSELFDAGANAYAPTAALTHARCLYATARLQDGRVLVLGGETGASGPWTVEIYDPASGAFSDTGALDYGMYATGWAVTLDDGSVLVLDGASQGERYDTVAGAFARTGAPNIGRTLSTGTLLRDGRVLLVGGCGDCQLDGAGSSVASAEIYTR